MTASAYHDLPLPQYDGFIGFRPTQEQERLIRKAAELSGWSISDYVLCAVLDRAEREVHEDAARAEWERNPAPPSIEPFESLIRIYDEL
ncbi:MAG TPA: DUF1778 domain-containing protein [Actinomadura sp.]|jgi:hypothetical protein|nr:DUF1778 domain-containing protein [Actinomadura sp.]